MLNKKYSYRIDLMIMGVFLIFLILIGRMAYLQIYKGDYYSRQADGNRIRTTKIIAPRGLIYDCNGELLVRNEPGFVVSLMRMSDKYDQDVIKRLAGLINMTPAEINTKIKESLDTYEPIRIKSNLTPELVTKIEENIQYLPGVLLELQPIRRYINNEFAVHALGYVGEISEYEIANGRYTGLKAGSIIGKFGLENFYDALLRGKDGSFDEEVDVGGRVIQTLDKKDPIAGQGLILTIDAKIQRAAEKATDEALQYLHANGIAPNARAAAVVVMDPRNGEIKALVSRPNFNPNLFVTGISEKDWQVINNDEFDPMSDKVIAGEYPPGSTFKIVTGSAALESGKVTPEELIFDSGKHWLIPMENAGGEALGWLNFVQALAASDNVYFYEMGNRIGIDILDKFAKAFGFGAVTGIDLKGESEGVIPSPDYKMKVFEEDWYLGDTFNAAIGQGFTLATPLQLAVMMSAVATDGVRYKPHLVKKIINDDGSVVKEITPVQTGKLPLSDSTLSLIQEGLLAVTQEGGTASNLASLPVAVAGKTGTAENPHGQDHGLFVAYAPAKNPSLVVVAVVEQGSYGSLSAAPIVQGILEAVFAPPKPTESGQLPKK